VIVNAFLPLAPRQSRRDTVAARSNQQVNGGRKYDVHVLHSSGRSYALTITFNIARPEQRAGAGAKPLAIAEPGLPKKFAVKA